MTTYFPKGGVSRVQGATKCLWSLINHLKSPVPIRLHIADDGSDDEYYNDILELLAIAKQSWELDSSFTQSRRKGIGGSLNLALGALTGSEYILYTTDDWLLHDSLSLDQAIKLLGYGYGMVRLGPIHPNLKCITKFNTDVGWWLDINPHYGYAFATRPFIANYDFFKLHGPFDEGLNAYETERLYAEKVAHSKMDYGIAQVGHINLAGPWTHVGELEVGTINP